jgi:hypothetical protein
MYAYYRRWERRRTGARFVPPRVAFQYVLRLLAFAVPALVLGFLAVYFVFRNDLKLAVLFSIGAALLSVFGLRRIRKEGHRWEP